MADTGSLVKFCGNGHAARALRREDLPARGDHPDELTPSSPSPGEKP